jgi:AcrR family transcriptional regulator
VPDRTDDVPTALPRHRHGLSRDTVRASQARRLLAATAAVVSEKGYPATSVSAITRRAGVSTKTFYELYADKEEAFLAAYAGIDAVIGRMTTAATAAGDGDPRGMLRASVRAYLEALAREPAFTRMFVIEAVGAGPRVLRRRAEAFAAFVRAFATGIRLAREQDPTIPEPDDLLLLAVLGGINELVLQHLVEHEAATLIDLARPVDELIERVCFPA